MVWQDGLMGGRAARCSGSGVGTDRRAEWQTGRPIDRKERTDRGCGRTCPTCPPPHSLTPSYGSALMHGRYLKWKVEKERINGESDCFWS